jgi:hypothetical protein
VTYRDLLPLRLVNQRLSRTAFTRPEQVVAWLGAVQAQDYPPAKWAVAQRMKGATDAALDEALASAAIVRTHVMRPTWHFVAPADVRWLLKLTGPRVHATCASYYRKLGLDGRLFARCESAMIRALEGGGQLTRSELKAALARRGVVAADEASVRFAFLLMHAELEGVICSGPRSGKHFTYALLDERVPPAPARAHDEARAELVRRFFTSHGPATLKDFVWWSGLTTADARAGLGDVGGELVEETIDAEKYWRPRSRVARTASGACLLPIYDEAILTYRDNRAEFAPYAKQLSRDVGHVVVVDGRAVGSWRKTVTRTGVRVEATPFRTFTRRERQAIAEAVERYGRFLGVAASSGPRSGPARP